jgi:hypothetical protein
MEWTQETVIQFIDGYQKKQIMWDPKHPPHFNKTNKTGNVRNVTLRRVHETIVAVEKQ